MYRTERHILLRNNVNFNQIDELSYLSKNLFNYINYQIRQAFIKKEELPDKYELIKLLIKEDQIDYRSLSSQTSQQIILRVFDIWKSFFNLIKSKTQKKVGLPKYKKKEGRNIIIFTNQQAVLKNNYINFPKKTKLKPIKTKVDNIHQVRIIPQSTCYIVEVIYKKEVISRDLNESLYIGIDLGVNNLCSIASNKKLELVLINGRIIKSINQYYNKKLAYLKSIIKIGTSKRIQRLHFKRNNKINDYLHKSSRFVINHCIENKIKNIVIGYNKNWKTKINLGKINNQKFVQISFLKLVQQIQYKAEENNINVTLTEESYTSKCDSLNNERLCKHKRYSGKRIKRGLFSSKVNKLINADINGSINILRKVVSEASLNVN